MLRQWVTPSQVKMARRTIQTHDSGRYYHSVARPTPVYGFPQIHCVEVSSDLPPGRTTCARRRLPPLRSGSSQPSFAPSSTEEIRTYIIHRMCASSFQCRWDFLQTIYPAARCPVDDHRPRSVSSGTHSPDRSCSWSSQLNIWQAPLIATLSTFLAPRKG